MPSMKTRKRRMAARIDDSAIGVALKISSLMVWVFYAAAAVYVAYCHSFFLEKDNQLLAAQSVVGQSTPTSLLQRVQLSHKYSRAYYFFFPGGFDIAAFLPLLVRVLAFSAAAILSTYYFAVRYDNGGEMIMFIAWLIGVLSDRFWLTSPIRFDASGASELIKNATIAAASVSADASASGGATSIGPSGEVLVVYDSRIPTVPGWLWLAVSIATGFFSGVMCKVKDIADGKIDRGDHLLRIFEDEENGDETVVADVRVLQRKTDAGEEAVNTAAGHARSGGMEGGSAVTSRRRRGRGARGFGSRFVAFGERLYIVVPFWTGQWFAFILRHGWRGVFIENCILVLTLGMIGYTMLSFKLLREQVYRASGRTTVVRYRRTVSAGEGGSDAATIVEEDEVETSVDLIDLISKIFTTSFGAVGVAVIAVNVFITMLVIPFFKTLFKLNALVSSIGILVELFVYEMT